MSGCHRIRVLKITKKSSNKSFKKPLTILENLCKYVYLDILEIDSRASCIWDKGPTTELSIRSFNLHIFFFLLSKRKLNTVTRILTSCLLYSSTSFFYLQEKRKKCSENTGFKNSKNYKDNGSVLSREKNP